MSTHTKELFNFCDTRDIRLGHGRIVWGAKTITTSVPGRPSVSCISGWVLPGGRRTIDLAEAYRVARKIDALYALPSMRSRRIPKLLDGQYEPPFFRP